MPAAKQFGLNMNKRKLKRIDWDIAKTILKVLYHEGKMKKTNIAMMSRTSYANCILYLDWLETVDFIKKLTDDEGFELVYLSERGRDFYVQRLE